MVEPKDTIKIENVVASTGIGQEINLKAVTLALEGADYDPEQFPGLVYRTKDPKTAALIFRSGKIVCTGAKSIEDVYKGLDKVFDSLRKIGVEVKGKPEIKVQNIVASADIGSILNLNAIAVGLGLENIRVRAGTVSRARLSSVGSKSRRSSVRFREACGHRWAKTR